jgi:type I restriction system specificity protein
MKSDVTSKNKISKKREEMSRLDEVIKELCPNGVEYKELKDICVIKKGVQLNKEKLLEEAEYPVINGGILPSGYWNDYNVKENTITISQGGASAGYVQYISTKFWAGAHCYYLELKDKNINYRYIYHFIKMKQDKLTSSQVGAGIPSIEKKILENLLIPVPPLEVQDEIVRILDDYTKSVEELKEKLNKELIARKKQYSWYRDYLLKFENKVEIVTLGDISEYSKDKIDIKELSSENYIGIENMLQDAKGVIKSSCLLTEGRCTKFFEGDILIGNIRPYLKKIWLSDRVGGANTDVLVIKKSIESIDNKYLFFVLSSEKFFSYVMRSVKAGKMPRGNKEMIMKYQFPLPPLEVQKRIVEVLDNFEKICNDLNTGLPAEIEARQKQYEFYRNYLLTFEEKSRQAILACELA